MSEVTEQEIEKTTVAPRVTLDGLEANIKHEYYFNVKEAIEAAGFHGVPTDVGVLTMCVLVLQNGYTVTGQSACADPANYNKLIGERLALSDAKNKIWALMGYELKTEVARAGGTHQSRAHAELFELTNRIVKLAAFVSGDTFKTLDSAGRTDMYQQLAAMRDYEKVLDRRVNRMS